jgi:hypothetical protein
MYPNIRQEFFTNSLSKKCKIILQLLTNIFYTSILLKKILYIFCLMVEASDHGYVLHTRLIHVTRYNVVRVSYIFFRTSNYVQQRKTYTRKAATVYLNCSTVPCNTLCKRISAAIPCNTLCVRIAAAV